MARFRISGTTTIAPTAALPAVSLYATAGVRPRVKEVGITNTTATAFYASLNRLTTAGTQGAGLTEVPMNDPAQTAVTTGFAGHTVGPTVGGELGRAKIGAADGSGIVWTFGGDGLVISNTTGDGIGIICPSGTGQILTYWFEWEE